MPFPPFLPFPPKIIRVRVRIRVGMEERTLPSGLSHIETKGKRKGISKSPRRGLNCVQPSYSRVSRVFEIVFSHEEHVERV